MTREDKLACRAMEGDFMTLWKQWRMDEKWLPCNDTIMKFDQALVELAGAKYPMGGGFIFLVVAGVLPQDA